MIAIDHTRKVKCILKVEAGRFTMFSCGLASLKTLLSFWQIEAPPLEEWMQEAIEDKVVNAQTGFQWEKGAKWLKKMGAKGEFYEHQKWESLLPYLKESPLLVSVQTEKGGHIVVLVGAHGEKIPGIWTYYDPETGTFEKKPHHFFVETFNGRFIAVS